MKELLRDDEISKRSGGIRAFFADCGINAGDDYEAQIVLVLAYRATLHSERLRQEIGDIVSPMRHRLRSEEAFRREVDALLTEALPLCNVKRFPQVIDAQLRARPAADARVTQMAVRELAHVLIKYANGLQPTFDVEGFPHVWLTSAIVVASLREALFSEG